MKTRDTPHMKAGKRATLRARMGVGEQRPPRTGEETASGQNLMRAEGHVRARLPESCESRGSQERHGHHNLARTEVLTIKKHGHCNLMRAMVLFINMVTRISREQRFTQETWPPQSRESIPSLISDKNLMSQDLPEETPFTTPPVL